jgi:DNA-binding MarR family transcriptional regulator
MPSPRRGQPDAAQALAAVAPLATRWIERLLAQHDPPLTVTQYLALRAIAREGVSGTELARRSGVSGPAVSQLLAGLADAGLVERQPVDSDRRRLALVLSATGRRAFAAAEALLGERLGSLLAEALSRLLPRVEATLSGAHPPRRPPHPPPPPPPRPGRGPRPKRR